MSYRKLLTALAAGSIAASAAATTIAPPRDLGVLLHMSDAVVLADAYESWNEPGRSVPLTVTRFATVRQVAGTVPSQFEVEELGGVIEQMGFAVAGSPRYEEGHRYLLFLDRTQDARFRSRVMAWGLLVEDERRGTLRPLPQAADLVRLDREGYEMPAVYRRDALLDHLVAVAHGARWDAGKLYDLRTIWENNHDDPAACRFMIYTAPPGDNLPIRHFDFETGSSIAIFATTPDQDLSPPDTVDGAAAVQAAVNAWTNHTDSVISYGYAGTKVQSISPACSAPPGFVSVAAGEAVFNDPCEDIPDLSGCSGTLGFGGQSFSLSTQTYDGEPWHPAIAVFMVVNDGAECIGQTGFNEMMTHELGHSLGFNHHTDGNATMSTPLNNDGRGASLAATDRACASYAYHTWRDVRLNGYAWGHIEAIENAGITQGCGNSNFCPGDVVRRQELAALLLRAKFGSGYSPACTPGAFADVNCATTPFAAFITDLEAKGATLGCDGAGNLYCPTSPVTREQLAKMLLILRGNGPEICNGGNPSPYTDISCSDLFGPWAKQLRVQGITLGCNAANTLFCPKDAVTRAELAILLARGFGLSVP